MQILHFLNQYANLLLVVVTVSYVFLTWRTLKALERASRKDLEVKHLEEIKNLVAEPVLGWLGGILNALGGRPWDNQPLLAIGAEPTPKKEARLDESPWNYRWQIRPKATLWEPGAKENLGSISGTGGIWQTAICSDARSRHFRAQMSQLEAFLKEWQAFLSGVATFADNCARKLQGESGLSHMPTDGPGPDQFVNADYFVESCIRQLIGHAPLHFEFPATGAQSELVSVSERSSGGRNIAQARDRVLLKGWVETSSEYVRARWQQAGFPERVRQLLEETQKVRQQIESITLTHFLPGSCEYVGGRRRWVFPRNWIERIRHRF